MSQTQASNPSVPEIGTFWKYYRFPPDETTEQALVPSAVVCVHGSNVDEEGEGPIRLQYYFLVAPGDLNPYLLDKLLWLDRELNETDFGIQTFRELVGQGRLVLIGSPQSPAGRASVGVQSR